TRQVAAQGLQKSVMPQDSGSRQGSVAVFRQSRHGRAVTPQHRCSSCRGVAARSFATCSARSVALASDDPSSGFMSFFISNTERSFAPFTHFLIAAFLLC